MGIIRFAPCFLISSLVLVLAVSITKAQTSSNAPAQQQVAKASGESSATAKPAANLPIFKDYRGVQIGMSADEVRAKLDRIEKGKAQDYLVFSDKESAQIFYDANNQVTAISIDYFGGNSNAPSPETVLGVSIQPKPDGSVYQLNRYPEAGYWVSYNRTAGDKPIVTITMQKL